MKNSSTPHIISSISEWHELFRLPKPFHPLITIVDAGLLRYEYSDVWKNFVLDFYCISHKQGHNCKLRYGQKTYDFDDGVMIFTKPGQVFKIQEIDYRPVEGYIMLIKPDLIRNYPLAKIINDYGFFSYSISEALHLSDSEKTIIATLMEQILQELKMNIDHFSQDIIVSHIDLLLNYSNRFYNRQFITRKVDSSDILAQVELILTAFFSGDKLQQTGVPTVQQVAEHLNVSPNYLSDMLRNRTGQTTLQHIHSRLIEKSKELLTTTNLSVSEIAYQLGFEYPQSFNKLFKNKTNVSPLEFRGAFN